MTLFRLDTLQDARLDVYARLTDAQLRSKLEPDRAVLIAESPNVILRALEAGLEPLSLLTSVGRCHVVADLCERLERTHPDLPLFVIPDEEFASLTGFRLTRGALAAFRRPSLPSVDAVLAGAHRVCVLENITNHMNVGAIFRSAAALGVDAVLVSAECSDPFYRRSARVSMGAVFQVPWTRIAGHSAASALGKLRESGFFCAALALTEDALILGDPPLREEPRLALVFGTEGEGLEAQTIAACDCALRIPMDHDVDSLNVAAASAVAFWATRPLR